MSNWEFVPDGSEIRYSGTDDLLGQYQQVYQRVFQGISVDPSTPQGQLISARTEESAEILSQIQSLANYFFLGGSGASLDAWAYNHFMAKRKTAINGSAVIQIVGKAGVKIPAGFLISDGDLEYELSSDVTIGANGQAEAVFICMELSNKASAANTITRIVTSMEGVDRVNNSAPSSTAIPAESDSDFYKRCIFYGSLSKNFTFKSIMANVAQVQGVSKINGYENFTSSDVTINGFVVKPHSVAIVVLGGADKDIAQAIAESKPLGCNTTGSTSVQISIAGVNYNFNFTRPSVQQFKAEITCYLNAQSPSSYVEIVRKKVVEYFNGVEIGALVSQPSLAGGLNDLDYNFDIVDVKISRVSDKVGYSTMQLKFNEIAAISEANIVVKKLGV